METIEVPIAFLFRKLCELGWLIDHAKNCGNI